MSKGTAKGRKAKIVEPRERANSDSRITYYFNRKRRAEPEEDPEEAESIGQLSKKNNITNWNRSNTLE